MREDAESGGESCISGTHPTAFKYDFILSRAAAQGVNCQSKGTNIEDFKGWYIEEGAPGALSGDGRGAVDPFKGIDTAIAHTMDTKGDKSNVCPDPTRGTRDIFGFLLNTRSLSIERD